jgi:hypothetical protein
MPEVDGRVRELVDQVQTAVADAVVTCLASAGTTNPLGRSGIGRSNDPVLAIPARGDRSGDCCDHGRVAGAAEGLPLDNVAVSEP